MKAFDGFEAAEAGKIEHVRDRVVRSTPVFEAGQGIGKKDSAHALWRTIGKGRGLAAIGGIEAQVDRGNGGCGDDGQLLAAGAGRAEMFRGDGQITRSGRVGPHPHELVWWRIRAEYCRGKIAANCLNTKRVADALG